jgi:hypothetical protein
MRPKFSKIVRPQGRGRRERRVLAAPAVSCANLCEKRTRAYRYRRSIPTFPAQWLYGLWRALPGDEFFLVTVARGLRLVWRPVGPTRLRRLDISNGCRNHTLLPYAAPGFANWLIRAYRRSSARCVRSRTLGPPCQHHHAPNAAASTATRPTFVTMANAPLSGRDGGSCKGDLGLASRGISENQKFCYC